MERKILCRMVFGSKLYGTDTPESDTDYKSVFMPTPAEILTGKIPDTINMTTGKNNSRNGKDDVDHESFSLHFFMQLLYQGQTVALDMLHAPDTEEISTPVWRMLKMNKQCFYTKNMRAFVGYARKQAAKYGIKGSRLESAREVLAFLMTQGDRKIHSLYLADELWQDEHCHVKLIGSEHWEADPQKSYWEVCGKKMTFGSKASYFVPMMKKFYDNYGGRAKLAAANQGIDWKAISHAFRVAFQTRLILQGKGFSYPLDETQELRKIKNGDWDYTTVVAPALDRLMSEIEVLAESSRLQETVDADRWNKWLASCTMDYLEERNES